MPLAVFPLPMVYRMLPRVRRVVPVQMTSLPDAFRFTAAVALPCCHTTLTAGFPALHPVHVIDSAGGAEAGSYQIRAGITLIEVNTPPLTVQLTD